MERTKSAHRDINAITITGRLVRDCETRETPKGKVVRFRIASANGDGKTTFIDCESWNISEKIIQYLVKGKEVNIIHARLMYDEWINKDGERRNKNFLSIKDLTLGKSPNRNKQSSEEENLGNELDAFLDEDDSEDKPF